MNRANLDEFILSQVGATWTKVALIVGRAMTDMKQTEASAVAERIKALVAAGRLEAQGSIEEWRHSEIRKGKA